MELATRDRQAFEVLQQWMNDPRFAHLGAHLETIKGRLEQFVKASGQTQP